jgi:hypothetical protein
MIVRMENLVERTLAGETEVLGENLPQRHFVHHKFPLDQTRTRTRATVGSQRPTAWAMVRPNRIPLISSNTSITLIWKTLNLMRYFGWRICVVVYVCKLTLPLPRRIVWRLLVKINNWVTPLQFMHTCDWPVCWNKDCSIPPSIEFGPKQPQKNAN